MLTPFDLLFWRHNIHPTFIAHLGASDDAKEAPFYDKYCPGNICYLEALHKVHARLADKLREYGKRHRAICVCLSDTDGVKVPFNIADNGGQSSSMLPPLEHTTEHPQVKFIHTIELETTRFDTLMTREGIELPEYGCFANLDLQGCELLALKGMGTLLDRFGYLYCEYSTKELYKGCVLEPELDIYLAARGFQTVERFPTDHGWGDKVYLRKPL